LTDYECKQKRSDFKIERKNCSNGVHGNISIIKSKSDGKEFIWKRPVKNRRIHIKSFKKEIEKAKKWREFGLSKVKVFWHPDKKSLIKTLIKGPTLRQMLHGDSHFFSDTHKRVNKELGKFVRCLVENRHYIQDLNRANLVYDKECHKWNIIDSSNIQKKSSRHEIANKFKRTFTRSWGSSLESDKEKEALEKFLNKYCK
jgi:hypothetical protein